MNQVDSQDHHSIKEDRLRPRERGWLKPSNPSPFTQTLQTLEEPLLARVAVAFEPPALQIERKPDPDHEHQTERNRYGHDERRRLTPKRKQEVPLVEIGKAPLFRLRMVRRAVGDLSHAVADADDLDQLALRLVFPVFARKAFKNIGVSISLFMHLPEGCSLTLDSPPTNSMTLK